ncbi:GNAT family acetyltransferase [Bacillus sp. T33-2]|uniref:GNAT family acetyltransferase n=1 Tax=Bacillus sp. T33-2 TaxID=2054168 RepID=UPI000C78597D|nr:GNAT family acetyltransferase [Bacillus sp. T33-2]PLR95058.1 GNAT family acetyltransferase [Bacillus sp. T33-2]
MQIREFTIVDYDAVIHLWEKAGIQLSKSDSLDKLQHKLQRDAELFIVAEESNQIIGVVMGSYDGRRGWVHHLAVDPDFQGRKIGSMLLENFESRLRAIGCEKVNLLIEMDNSNIQKFYETLGYNRDELIFMEKWIV